MKDPIYPPQGKAGEYAQLALNVYSGCVHGCSYCYAPMFTHVPATIFNQPRLRPGLLEEMEKQLLKWPQDREKYPVLMSFSCDPYQLIDEREEITRKAIALLRQYNFPVRILSKGGLRAVRDFDLLRFAGSEYGATLTFTSNNDSRKWEPGAALPGERIHVLEWAHNTGIPTWVSLEPVIDPQQTLDLIDATHGFVDRYAVGRWNYDDRAVGIDWTWFLKAVTDKFNEHGCRYFVKQSLEKYRK